jgi:hypothetical protein
LKRRTSQNKRSNDHGNSDGQRPELHAGEGER